jgi:hypothetical protein
MPDDFSDNPFLKISNYILNYYQFLNKAGKTILLLLKVILFSQRSWLNNNKKHPMKSWSRDTSHSRIN